MRVSLRNAFFQSWLIKMKILNLAVLLNLYEVDKLSLSLAEKSLNLPVIRGSGV